MAQTLRINTREQKIVKITANKKAMPAQNTDENKWSGENGT